MYLDFFQLSRKPFSLVPSANGCILVPSLKRELNRCLEAIEESRCPVMIAGPSGCSKSIMLALIENHFAREIRTVRLDCASLANRIELIQSMLGEMGLRFGSESVGELRLRMIDFLKSSEHCPNGLLLLVDEAQMLTDEVLEELRLMTNLVCSGRSQVRLVLAGSLALEENVSRKESFNQRITVRCYPRGLTQNETMLFVLAQMQLAGRDGREVFQPSALEKIHSLSGGVPRVICQLCDNALRFAAREQHSPLDASVVEASWYDLQQLPIPESLSSGPGKGPSSSKESVIEFGSLSDESPGKPTQWASAAASKDSSNEASATMDEPFQQSDPWEEPDSMDSMDDGLNIDDDGYFVAETESHTDVDETLQTLLKQLDEYEVAEKERADNETAAARGTGEPATSADVEPRKPNQQQPEVTKKPVDSSNVFGNDYEMEEDVVDIQSLRISGQNRVSARTSSSDVSGIVEPDDSPAWMPVGNEIVFPFDADAQEPAPQAEPIGNDQSKKPQKADVSARPVVAGSRPSAPTADDDRDMIIVQESKKTKPDESSSESKSDVTPPASPAPTGNVIRMNYQELFRQLRNNTDVDQ